MKGAMGVGEREGTCKAGRVSPLGPEWLARVEFRPLIQQDLPALEWDGEYAHFRRLYRQVFQSTCQGKALMWVADLSGKGVIGQLFVHLNSARHELADGVRRAYVYGFRVQPKYRGFGVGARLLQTVEGDLKKRHFFWITLNVGRQNLGARRFYERHGYRVVAPEPGRWSYLDDRGRRREVHEPAWRMEKRIA